MHGHFDQDCTWSIYLVSRSNFPLQNAYYCCHTEIKLIMPLLNYLFLKKKGTYFWVINLEFTKLNSFNSIFSMSQKKFIFILKKYWVYLSKSYRLYYTSLNIRSPDSNRDQILYTWNNNPLTSYIHFVFWKLALIKSQSISWS